MAATEWYPYYLVDRITYGAAGTGTLQLTIGATEEFQGEQIFFTVSAGAFNIVKISDSSGKAYSNCDANNPISGALFTTAVDQNANVGYFTVMLQLVPNTSLFIETSGGTDTATLDCIVIGKRRAV